MSFKPSPYYLPPSPNTPMLPEHLTIIRRLIESFIDHPASLKIELSNRSGSTYLMMQCHADDHAKMVGKGGSHFHALRMIIAELGAQAATSYKLCRYLEPEPAERSERMPVKNAESYSPATACKLLEDLFGFLCAGQYAVEADFRCEMRPLTYVLNITTRDATDYIALTRYAAPTEIVPHNAEAPMTLIGAIGTLFRAYANRDGVRFSIQLKKA